MLTVENLYYKAGGKPLIHDVSATFKPGKLNMIIGPNGSGKSTLLKLLAGQLLPVQGNIFLEGNNLNNFNIEALACKRAVLSQQTDLPFPLSVEEVVMMGRYPHFRFKPKSRDIEICHAALAKMHMSEFRERNYLTLSGGEQQRVHFARVLAQIWGSSAESKEQRYLFLDEPIASLDLKFQHEFLKIAKELVGEGVLVIAIIHDLNLALQYGDLLVALKEGRKVAEGRPGEIITKDLMQELFGVSSRIVHIDGLNYPTVII